MKTKENSEVNDMTTPFDKKIDFICKYGQRVPYGTVDAFIHVNDTLETVILIAKNIFGSRPSTEQIFEIYDRVEEERLRLTEEHETQGEQND
jgi:hypothetical protein